MVAGLRSTLASSGVDVIGEVEKGSLILISDRDHLVEGHFDAERMLRQLAEALQRALNGGYQGLCAIGDMSWEAGFHSSFPALLDYCGWRSSFAPIHSFLGSASITQTHFRARPRMRVSLPIRPSSSTKRCRD